MRLTWKAVHSTRWTWWPSCPTRSLPGETWSRLVKVSCWQWKNNLMWFSSRLYLGYICSRALDEDILCLQGNFWVVPWKKKKKTNTNLPFWNRRHSIIYILKADFYYFLTNYRWSFLNVLNVSLGFQRVCMHHVFAPSSAVYYLTE